MDIKIKDGKKYTNIINLKKWDLNPRSMTEKGFERLKKQIKKLGQHTPLIIKEDGTVMSGNMRLKAMLDMGLKDIWIELIPKDKEQLAIEYALSANDRAGKYEADQLANLIGNFPDVEWGAYTVDISEPLTTVELQNFIAPEDFSSKNKEIDTNDLSDGLNCTCPKCGFTFQK